MRTWRNRYAKTNWIIELSVTLVDSRLGCIIPTLVIVFHSGPSLTSPAAEGFPIMPSGYCKCLLSTKPCNYERAAIRDRV